MRALFSIRYEPGIKKRIIALDLQEQLRNRLCSVVRGFDELNYSSWADDPDQSTKALTYLCDCLGIAKIPVDTSASGEPVAVDFNDVIQHASPPYVLDAIEAYNDKLFDDTQRNQYISRINEAFKISLSPLRMLDGNIIQIESTWLSTSAIMQAQSLMNGCGYYGPIQEFNESITALQNGNAKDAISKAYHALESVQKAILNVDREKPGKLLGGIRDLGLIPDYCDGFVNNFEKLFASINSIRNDAPGAGHGQGRDKESVPYEIAELMIHLAGSLIVFLLKHHIAKKEPVDEGGRRLIN